jgi:hypothetical protein
VVIAETTRRILGDLFEFSALAPSSLKGFAEPVLAWRVIGEGRAESRFEALHGTRVTPLVGRDEVRKGCAKCPIPELILMLPQR